MKRSTAGIGILLVGAGAANLAAAVDTTGSNIALNGSDTLFDVTQSVLASCNTAFADFSTQGIRNISAAAPASARPRWD